MIGKSEHVAELMDKSTDPDGETGYTVELLRYSVAVDSYPVYFEFRVDRRHVVAVWPDGIAHRRVRLAVTGVEAIYVVDKAVAISIEDGEVNVVFLFGDSHCLGNHLPCVGVSPFSCIIGIVALNLNRSEHMESGAIFTERTLIVIVVCRAVASMIGESLFVEEPGVIRRRISGIFRIGEFSVGEVNKDYKYVPVACGRDVIAYAYHFVRALSRRGSG